MNWKDRIFNHMVFSLLSFTFFMLLGICFAGNCGFVIFFLLLIPGAACHEASKYLFHKKMLKQEVNDFIDELKDD